MNQSLLNPKWLLLLAVAFSAAAYLLKAESTGTDNRLLIPTYDTIKFHLVNTEHYLEQGKHVYKVNGHKVSKKTFEKYPVDVSAISDCKPCYVRAYSRNNKLSYEGDMYTDCPVGHWREYYPSGKIKLIGEHKRNASGVFDTLQPAQWCGIRDGQWSYYNESGSIDSVVTYSNGIRIEKK